MSITELYERLAELKSNYTRIQEDMDKSVSVGGRVSLAQEQLNHLEGEIDQVNQWIDDAEAKARKEKRDRK